MIGVDPDHQGTGLGRALTVGGLEHLATESAVPGRHALRRRRQPRRARPLPRARLHGAPRPTARTSGTCCEQPLRRDHATSSRPGSPKPASPGTGSTRSTTRSIRQRVPLEDATVAPPRAAHRASPKRSRSRSTRSSSRPATTTQTLKWLWRSRRDGVQVETVLMRYPTRATVCVSSQAGCAMGCTFCATGQAGFERNLDAGRDRRAGRARRARVAAAGQQRRLHGHGRAARQLRRDVERGRAHPRRPRPLGPPHHDLDRGHRPRASAASRRRRCR